MSTAEPGPAGPAEGSGRGYVGGMKSHHRTPAAIQLPVQLPVPPSLDTVHRAYLEELGPEERAALMSWAGFTTTFATVRGITYSIRHGKGPFGNLSVGGAHLHHYMWGIAMLSGVGAVAVHGSDSHRRHPAVALSYGVALALIVDEFALLLDLDDVYWTKQGRVSIDLGIGLVAVGGTTLAALPMLQRLFRRPAPSPAPSPSPAPAR